MNRLMLALALVDGLAIARIDSGPTWDDAGITAGMLFISAGFFTLLAPRRPWLVALLVGAWVPAHAIARTQNFTALIALLFAFIGAYSAFGIRKLAGEVKASD